MLCKLLAPQQIEDLRLDGDVQRGGRLVGDQEFRLAGQCDGNGNPLAHAAGQLMRILVQAFCRQGNPDRGEKLDRAGFGRRGRASQDGASAPRRSGRRSA